MTATWAQNETLCVDGKTLEYSCFGPPPSKAPTLVLLHEGLGCARLWRSFPTALSNATGFGVFAYSRAGYGQSSPALLPRPLNYMTQEAANILPSVLELMDIKRAVLLGHSDGATIAAIHAGEHADHCLVGLILIAPHFFTETCGLTEIARARDAFQNGDLRERLNKYHRDVDNAFCGWNDAWLDPAFEAWNVAGVLDTIHVPVLAIQGRDDPYGTLAQIDVVTQRVRRATVKTLVLNECRHAPHFEHPQQVIAAIVAFCEGLNPEHSCAGSVD